MKGLGKKLKEKNLLGDTEIDWLERFDMLLGATYSLASKKGTHKPDPKYAEAQFCVRVATAVIDYIVSLLL